MRKTAKTVPYDIAEQLRTPEEMAAYLDAWLVEAPDDVAGIARALGDLGRTFLKPPQDREVPGPDDAGKSKAKKRSHGGKPVP